MGWMVGPKPPEGMVWDVPEWSHLILVGSIKQDTLSSSNKIYYHTGLLTIHALKPPWDTSMTMTALHILCGIGHVVPCVACSEWEKEHILIMYLTRTVVLYTVRCCTLRYLQDYLPCTVRWQRGFPPVASRNKLLSISIACLQQLIGQTP